MEPLSFKDIKSIPDICSFRLNYDVFEKCTESQIINTIPSDAVCVYSSDSFEEFLRKEQKKVIYLSEAEIKTYPTDFLTKDLMKHFCNEFEVDVYVGPTLNKTGYHYFELHFKESEKSSIKEVSEKELDDKKLQFDKDLLIFCKYQHVEGNVAGKITYIIYRDFKNPKRFFKDYIWRAYTFGYNFVSMDKFYDPDNERYAYSLIFESKFQDNADMKIEGEFLWHVCPSKIKDKILKSGLQPRSKTMMNGRKLEHDARIYLLTRFPPEKAIEDLMLRSKKANRGDKILILKIDRKKVPHLKLYRDNMSLAYDDNNPIAVYTLSNIPPTAISIDKEVELK